MDETVDLDALALATAGDVYKRQTPTNGAGYYDGKNIRELGEVYRSKFGFLPQDFGYHRDFTVKDYLEYR